MRRRMNAAEEIIASMSAVLYRREFAAVGFQLS
jgi:hypothetical protein